MYVKVEGFDCSRMSKTSCRYLQFIADCLTVTRFNGFKIVKRLTHHGFNELESGKIHYRIFTYKLTVSKNRYPVTYCINLLKEVGNKDNSYTLALKHAHYIEKLLNLFIIQR